MVPRLAALLACLTPALCAINPIVLNGAAAHHRFDGVGGLSAGASSRLLYDYPAEQRSDILDFLFKPNFGGNLHICKVEIGGDCQSTDGTEASHMHTRDDLSCTRGYEWWLMQEAKARNPDVLTYGLSWGVPHWIGNGSYFSPDNWAYQTAFATCVRDTLGFELDYIGIWNERSWGSEEYVIGLRAALDAAGHTHTKIILPDDNVNVAQVIAAAQANASFNASFSGIGLHYQHDNPQPEVEANGKTYWNSEDYSSNAAWSGAQAWAQDLIRNYVNNNMTATIAWSTIWSVLPNLPYESAGLMLANTPWSGWYDASPPIWVSAHVCQFAQPGWRYLLVGEGSGVLTPGDEGAYTALVPPEGPAGGFTLILETIGKAGGKVAITLTGGLPGAGSVLHVWQTTQAASFVAMPDVTVGPGGVFVILLPQDGVVTVTTVATGVHGVPAHPIPTPGPLPLPYSDDFNSYAYDVYPRYLSDQGGSFAVRNGSLVQVVPVAPGPNAWVHDPDPITLIGDFTPWVNVTVTVTAAFTAAVSTDTHTQSVGPDGPNAMVVPCSPTAKNQVWEFGTVAPQYLSNTLGGNAICLNADGCTADLIYYECVTTGGTCCGESCYQGLQFVLESSGALTCPLPGLAGQCATVGADGSRVSMTPCVSGGSAAQKWSYNAATGAVSNAGTGKCLQSSLVPPQTYVQVCARLPSYSGFKHQVPVPAVCLTYNNSGDWSVLNGATVLGSGALPSPFDPTVPRVMVLTAEGTSVSASIGGTALGIFTLPSVVGGMVAFGSGFHYATFDDFSITPTAGL